jgi:hypothetical protein
VVTARRIRRRWLVLAGVSLALVLFIAGSFWTVERLARAALLDALPGFACEGLAIDVSKAQLGWNGSRYISAGLRMPSACRAEFDRRVSGEGQFGRSTCNGVDPCWERSTGREELTLTPYDDYVHYRYSQSPDAR